MRSSKSLVTVSLLLIVVLSAAVVFASDEGDSAAINPSSDHGRFTGEILPVFYVTDVLKSVEFYKAVGFEFHHFFDYGEGKRVQEWTKEEAPIWAEMAAGSQTFGIHRIGEGVKLTVGGMRHYFLVEDVDAYYRLVQAAGIETGEMIDKPWMKMFAVHDPDGHEIFFGTEK
jgi:catechol 2,3-dioxygenase-like lactoylglutathione lyase family enzyme